MDEKPKQSWTHAFVFWLFPPRDMTTVYGPYEMGEGDDTWHWHKDCSQWPKRLGVSKTYRPKNRKFCPECEAKDDPSLARERWEGDPMTPLPESRPLRLVAVLILAAIAFIALGYSVVDAMK